MADNCHSKIDKSPYLSNGLSDSHEIWHGDAHCPSEPHWPFKFRVFKNPRWRTAVILKIEKSRFKSKRLADLHEIWHGSAPLNHIGSQNFDLKIQYDRRPPY